MGFLRQTGTLVHKNFIILIRHPFTFAFNSFILPVILAIFFGVAQNLLLPPVTFGVGEPAPIRSLSQALGESDSRHRIVFVNSGFDDGPIDRVIDTLVTEAESVDGIEVLRRQSERDLNVDCEPGQRAVTDCFGAVVFHSSPTEGDAGIWSYTLFHDGAITGFRINVNSNRNDMDRYLLPLQKAVDGAISDVARANASDDAADSSAPRPADLPATIDRYPFTTRTEEEYREDVRRNYQTSVINFLAVAFLTTIILVAYHMTGFIAAERESGMIQLIDAMMPVRKRWIAQLARILSYHITFSLLYLPGWVISAIVLQIRIFSFTNMGIVLIYYIIAGLAMTSAALLISSFFQKAQLSGITALLSTALLGVLAQVLTRPGTGPVIALSLLFIPCNYVYFFVTVASYERERIGMNLVNVAPTSSFDVAGIVFWVFAIIQIFAYPAIGALIEAHRFGTSSKGRVVHYGQLSTDGSSDSDVSVRLEGFSKYYPPTFFQRVFSVFSKPRETVRAVDGLNLEARRGQILGLLGSNGSGKSTTLDCIAGTNKLTSGSITIDGTGGLGIAPQKNVLWDDLTVEEHVRIFNRLKSPGKLASKEEIRDLVKSIDLELKRKARSKTLSGGQKRKLQLGMMLTGGSAVCCVDEVSSGVDPLSRRKIWDILLAERGRRTIILTTHFLDEADMLSDQIVILSKGTLRASGSSVELKNDLGAGYRVIVPKDTGITDVPDVEGVQKQVAFDVITYVAPSSALAAQVIRTLEAHGIGGYRFSSPTIEDVFLHLAEEARGDSERSSQDGFADLSEKKDALTGTSSPQKGLTLMDGKPISYPQQAWILFRKRCTVFKTNWLPFVAAFLLPIIAAGLTTIFIQDGQLGSCAPPEENFSNEAQGLSLSGGGLGLVIGPSSRLNMAAAAAVLGPSFEYAAGGGSNGGGGGGGGPDSDSDGGAMAFLVRMLQQNTTIVDDFESFRESVIDRRTELMPGGLWLGDDDVPPTLAYRGNRGGMVNALLGQNILDMLLTNVTVSARYAPLEIPWADQNTDSLQLLVYMTLILCVYPGFFALYPSTERRGYVRGLQYSNGVRPLPLWLAYIAFDFSIVLVSSAICIALWAALSDIWYHVGYLYLIFILYGLASILLAYCVSLFSKTQLGAYASVALYQAVVFLIYMIGYFFTFTSAPIETVDRSLLIVHFVMSIFAPISSIFRTFLVALNIFSTACEDDRLAPNPAGMLQYGGPILYLVVQSALLLGFLLWADGGSPGSSIRSLFRRKGVPESQVDDIDEEVAGEEVRIKNPDSTDDNGLKVVNVTKSFGKNTAVDNVTFGIKRGEVFAVLGPNGAGKSTLISLIRGDLKPSRNGGDIFVEDKSVLSELAAARVNLGVCPQHDALDQMTVREHLEFYARVRGIADVAGNVEAILTAVGLQAFSDRMAHSLSGGNKRKLSLGIALMGNPTVVLLDEPSSGLDAAAKRIMWKTLAATIPGRSLLLTTHSMEEAAALATRAGILAKRMLALGTTENLRRRFGDALHVHLISKSAPYTKAEETERVRNWVTSKFPSAEFDKTYHGQMRFSVPASEANAVLGSQQPQNQNQNQNQNQITRSGEDLSDSVLGRLVVALEEAKEKLGVLHFSVSPTTLDQVFLTIVGRHNVQEEGYAKADEKKSWASRLFCKP
ncbi:ABC transporter [Sodiomyces alkalinus F11]|uniref:ABC transporter n=1 Tax=Sodiomyces alkalinus (strain CBS 110278 / VKM F-3762 / F11) TaxID=1314773 RepID=A0A3N2Q9B8_SODAK|nr:ABC transporter [Sodiomyces alkalinus F11]ROT43326.1 ABC transporter [Sodiomyces alkalinus F11]